MRRNRQLREYREKMLQQRLAAQERLSAMRKARLKKKTSKDKISKKIANQIDYTVLPGYKQFDESKLKTYDEYKCGLTTPVKVCHVIDSLGLGGAQTMMMEIFKALDKYYGDFSTNYFVCLASTHRPAAYDTEMYKSYGVDPKHVQFADFKKFCLQNDINIVVHHRVSVSKCLRKDIPKNCKYILVNHTWHNLYKISSFLCCDLYVSVCDFLKKRTPFPDFINNARKFTILNGVENDYLDSIPTGELDGSFKTGRCHRLVPSKFRPDSLLWMHTNVSKVIPGFTHYIMGQNKDAKHMSKKYNEIKYLGMVTDRQKKMSIIKGLDVYFYETFQDEGASIAILESLACGVPVLTKDFGGCGELVLNGVNGFICGDRQDYLLRMRQLNHKSLLDSMKRITKQDFDNRLHVKHTAAKYMQLFERLMTDANLPDNR